MAFLIYLNLNLPERRSPYLLTGGFTALFAFADEIHQAFIAERNGRLMDIILDVISGVVVLFLIYIWKIKAATEK
ncbi:VanZ family protein [Domibacillus sp. A3M-37]|nr:VanZ family protein [Domibacillus sp. A3M-37]